MQKVKYHSALRPELEGLGHLNFFEKNGNKVFVSNILSSGINTHNFVNCDVFYSEPAWRDGYEKFSERAGVEAGSYMNYVRNMSMFIHETKRPVYMVLGSHVINEFPKPSFVQRIKLHGYLTNLCCWNAKPLTCDTNYQAIVKLSMQYNCVGDFNAGYGNTARIFKEYGKNFVCSDINPKCIYFIAKTLMGYAE